MKSIRSSSTNIRKALQNPWRSCSYARQIPPYRLLRWDRTSRHTLSRSNTAAQLCNLAHLWLQWYSGSHSCSTHAFGLRYRRLSTCSPREHTPRTAVQAHSEGTSSQSIGSSCKAETCMRCPTRASRKRFFCTDDLSGNCSWKKERTEKEKYGCEFTPHKLYILVELLFVCIIELHDVILLLECLKCLLFMIFPINPEILMVVVVVVVLVVYLLITVWAEIMVIIRSNQSVCLIHCHYFTTLHAVFLMQLWLAETTHELGISTTTLLLLLLLLLQLWLHFSELIQVT